MCVCMGEGEKEAGGKERRGWRGAGYRKPQVCAGWWVGGLEREREDRRSKRVKESQVMWGLSITPVSSTESFLVETPEEKSNCFPEKVKLICQQCKTVLVQANEYKER